MPTSAEQPKRASSTRDLEDQATEGGSHQQGLRAACFALGCDLVAFARSNPAATCRGIFRRLGAFLHEDRSLSAFVPSTGAALRSLHPVNKCVVGGWGVWRVWYSGDVYHQFGTLQTFPERYISASCVWLASSTALADFLNAHKCRP